MGSEEQDRLATIAGTDADPQVRRIAIRKLRDVALLERVAAGETDRGLRDLAVERIQEVLVETASGAGPVAECEAALARLTDPKAPDPDRERSRARGHPPRRARPRRRRPLPARRRQECRGSRDPSRRTRPHRRRRHPARHRARGFPARRRAPRARADRGSRRVAGHRRHPHGGEGDPAARPGDARVATGGRVRDRDQGGTRTPARAARRGADAAHQGRRHAGGRACARVAARWEALARDVEPRDDVAAPFHAACEAILRESAGVARRRAEADHARTALEEGIAARRALCERIEALVESAAAMRRTPSRRRMPSRTACRRCPEPGGRAPQALPRAASGTPRASGHRWPPVPLWPSSRRWSGRRRRLPTRRPRRRRKPGKRSRAAGKHAVPRHAATRTSRPSPVASPPPRSVCGDAGRTPSAIERRSSRRTCRAWGAVQPDRDARRGGDVQADHRTARATGRGGGARRSRPAPLLRAPRGVGRAADRGA